MVEGCVERWGLSSYPELKLKNSHSISDKNNVPSRSNSGFEALLVPDNHLSLLLIYSFMKYSSVPPFQETECPSLRITFEKVENLRYKKDGKESKEMT